MGLSPSKALVATLVLSIILITMVINIIPTTILPPFSAIIKTMFGWYIFNGMEWYHNPFQCLVMHFYIGISYPLDSHPIPFLRIPYPPTPLSFKLHSIPYSNPNSLFLLISLSSFNLRFSVLFFNLLPPPSIFFNLPSPVTSCSLIFSFLFFGSPVFCSSSV